MKNDKTNNKKDQDTEKQEDQAKVEEKSEQEEVTKLKNQREELESKYKRALADYQNLEKRVQDERINWIRSSNKELLLRLLPVLDTLLMLHKHIKDQGLTVSIQQFLSVLAQEGVKQIPLTVGSKFDPNIMECIMTEEGEDGRVIEELRIGYKINDSILRPAQVKVGKEKMSS